MKKGNVVELRAYRRPRRSAEREGGHSDEERESREISKELQLAIKRLIQRMRKHGPMRKAKRA